MEKLPRHLEICDELFSNYCKLRKRNSVIVHNIITIDMLTTGCNVQKSAEKNRSMFETFIAVLYATIFIYVYTTIKAN